MKKLFTIIILFTLAACQSELKTEGRKTAKGRAASDRINSSESNGKDVFKELDE